MTPQNFSTYGAIALLVVGLGGILFNGRGLIFKTFSGVGRLLTSGTATTPAAITGLDEDTLDFQALTRMQKRFVRLKCPEGQTGVQTCLTHFYHGSEGQP